VRILPRLGERFLAWAKTPESTFAPGAFSPRRLYPRLGETTLSPGETLLAWAKTKPFSLGRDAIAERIMQKTQLIRQFMQVLLLQSYYTCLR